MTDNEILKMYADILKAIGVRPLDGALMAIGVVLADIAYRTSSPIVPVLTVVTKIAVENYEKLLEEEDESTKH